MDEMKKQTINIAFSLFFCIIVIGCKSSGDNHCKKAVIGVYYFDGWSGQNKYADDPDNLWAKDAPTHLTKKLAENFSNREPIWGWRDDDLKIMEQQIDLAADNGVDFFLFCWYWSEDKGAINPENIQSNSKHTSLELFMKAKNRHRVKYGLLIANHKGFEILGTDNWRRATEYWMQYFKDPQYQMVDGKPVVVIFDPKGIDKDGLLEMQNVAIDGGLPGLSVAGCGNRSNTDGFSYRTHYNIVPGYSAGPEEHHYSEIIDATKKEWTGSDIQPYIPVLTAGWDKRPWEGEGGLNQKEGWYYPDRSPEQLRSFINDAILWMDQNPTQTTKDKVLLLYAWNELGEGGFLVPTKADQQGEYLRAIKSVVNP